MIFRLGLFYCAAPLSGAFGGLLATGLAEINYHGYNRRFLRFTPPESCSEIKQVGRGSSSSKG